MEDSIRDIILKDIPSGFLERLLTRQEGLYGEAYSVSFDSTLWTDREAETIFPVVRRALFESEFRKAAQTHKLKVHDRQHEGENYGYVLARAGRLRLTAHQVSGPNQFVRPCVSRKQNAAVNRWVDAPPLPGTLQEALPDLHESGLVNAYILHGRIIEKRGGKKFTTSFLRIGIPDAELTRYRRSYDVPELLQLMAQKATGTLVTPEIADQAQPKFKKEKNQKLRGKKKGN